MINIAHKIELKPNNKQKTYFHKAFGCARFTYNWALAEWRKQYKVGGTPGENALRKQFNAIKHEQFPFIDEVTKFASEKAFNDVQFAFNQLFDFFKQRKQNPNFRKNEKPPYPVFKKKRNNEGSFFIGGCRLRLSETNKNSKCFKKITHNLFGKTQYVKIPKLGWIKMCEHIRFNGKIYNATISQTGDKYYISFAMEITDEEYFRTHPKTNKKKKQSIGIDLGIKSAMVLSNGISLDNPRPLKNDQKKLIKLYHQLEKHVHARTKQDKIQGVQKSNNYRKASVQLRKEYIKILCRRRDFIQKVTSILTSNYSNIAIESLHAKELFKKHKIAQSLFDIAFGEIRRQIEYKSKNNNIMLTKADEWYPSSKKCSTCGHVMKTLPLQQRIYQCECCGTTIDRDLNAAINLQNLISKPTIREGLPELTPADLPALLYQFKRNGIATSEVETGRQHKLRPVV